MFACSLAFCTNLAHAEDRELVPTTIDPDPPPRLAPPTSPSVAHEPSWDLDGNYLWLGPSGAASWVDSRWDSTIGGDLSIVRVREGERLGVLGGTLGASRWTVRGGGRIWLDALVGTRLGRMVGLSLGPMVELGELAHPRFGGSLGIWGFLGVTPYLKAGAVQELGGFVEAGVHIALPVIRRR